MLAAITLHEVSEFFMQYILSSFWKIGNLKGAR
jgi:hypothetical protein